MKKLTQEYLKSRLIYNGEKGDFIWKFDSSKRKCWNNRFPGKIAGCRGWAGKNREEYWLIRLDDVLYKAHTLAWLYANGEWPECIDHINLDGTDNKISNLRVATRSQNQCNHKIQLNNTSGYKGVSFHKGLKKWHAYIKINRKRIHLGFHNNPEIAHLAYCAAAKKYHGEFARVE